MSTTTKPAQPCDAELWVMAGKYPAIPAQLFIDVARDVLNKFGAGQDAAPVSAEQHRETADERGVRLIKEVRAEADSLDQATDAVMSAYHAAADGKTLQRSDVWLVLENTIKFISSAAPVAAQAQPPVSQRIPLSVIEALNKATGSNDWQGGSSPADLVGPACVVIATLAQQPVSGADGLPRVSEDVRAALLYALWHHQGGSSPVGQPIRAILGLGQHDRMTGKQYADAHSVRDALGFRANKVTLDEWGDKTEFIQEMMGKGELPVKYLGWHRADVMRDLIEQQDADKADAERWRHFMFLLDSMGDDDDPTAPGFPERLHSAFQEGSAATIAAIDAARKEQA